MIFVRNPDIVEIRVNPVNIYSTHLEGRRKPSMELRKRDSLGLSTARKAQPVKG